ncbi:MAG: hypothetical protein QOG53_1392 [Frankiales bacterium]|nr:hypothetical protein [Frankiales bacterium]
MSAPRRGVRWLGSMREKLSDREYSVLADVGRFKLLSGKQVQRLHFSDHATSETAARVCRRVLRRHTETGLLTRLERRIGGVRAGSAGAVYQVSGLGHRLLSPPDGRRRSSEPGLAFVTHTLAIAEVYVLLVEAQRTGLLELLGVQTEPTCWRHFTGALGQRDVLRPDLFVVLGIGADEWHWFVEVDCGTSHRPAIRAKAEIYRRYLSSGVEQHATGLFPGVLWLVPDLARREQLDHTLRPLDVLPAGLFSVALHDEAVDGLRGAPP